MKGWAVLWMILIHSVELFLRYNDRTHPLAQLVFFMGAVPAAPVFMFMMGFYIGSGRASGGNLAIRGLKVFFWGLLLNAGLNASLLIRWASGTLDVNPFHYLFGVDILLLAGMALVISGVLVSVKTPWFIWIMLAFAIPALNTMNLPWGPATQGSEITMANNPADFLLALVGGGYSWSYFPVIPWLGYVFAGVSLRMLSDLYPGLLTSKLVRLYSGIPSVVIFLAGLIPGWKIARELPMYYHHDFWFFCWALAMILILALTILVFRKWLEGPAGNWIRFLGVRVTSVYVIQWIIIGNLGTWLYQSMNITATLTLFAGVFILTLLLSVVYHRIVHQ